MALAAATAGFAGPAAAQEFKDVKSSKQPLVLESAGSFYVGGEKTSLSLVENGNVYIPAPDTIIINQMYVEYRIPKGHEKSYPVVMLHGATLSGKTYDTTPDGRMGWYEYFVRNGRSVFVPDQVGRARSGFDQRPYNNVRFGVNPPESQPVIRRRGEGNAWVQFRFGPAIGTAYPNEQFPLNAVDQFTTQGIPEFNAGLPTPNPNDATLAKLALEVGGAIVMGHSQSGTWPVSAAINDPRGVKGVILVEPGGCSATSYSEADMNILKNIPMLVVYGDNLDGPSGVPGFSWRASYNGCNALVARVNSVGGNAQMLYLPDAGQFGNSHMLMQDRNNLKVADLVMKWIDKNVPKRKGRGR